MVSLVEERKQYLQFRFRRLVTILANFKCLGVLHCLAAFLTVPFDQLVTILVGYPSLPIGPGSSQDFFASLWLLSLIHR
mgnify:CR=1 FL=1